MKSDEGGTRTARMASKNPNAQQFPKRSKLFDSKALRKCLVAEAGCQWAKLDFWSQEPILQTHYALGAGLPGAEEIKKQFAQGIKLATFIEQATSGRCNYDEAKEVALGRSYGMGKAKMSRRMGISEDECASILAAFDEVVPFIKLLADNISATARSRGYIKYFLGYRRRFQYWQPGWRNGGEWHDPLPHAAARELWGDGIERAYTYKAFNALCQGSGAIQAKKSLVEIYEAGIMPTLPVHDEINSANITDPKQAALMKEIMEHAIPLRLPARADLDLGTSWQ
jgi:DNA polymerase I-like protein with 3'-5' exonuclease and polymerase domains